MKAVGLTDYLALATLTIVCTVSGTVQGQELCAPFRNGAVEPTMVRAMLSAAEDGHLYRIVPSTSRVGFCANSEITKISAEFHTFQGGLSLWPDPGEQEMAMVVIDVDSLDTGDAVTEKLLKSKLFFNVETYPEILFVSTGIQWTSDDMAELKGKLTLHGVTRPVLFKVRLTSLARNSDGDIDKVLAKAGAVINRSDFGMDGLVQVVDDQVELCLTVEAVRFDGSDENRNPDSVRR